MRHSRILLLALIALTLISATLSGAGPAPADPPPATAASSASREPDYSIWSSLLQKYYDSAKGMDYALLKANDLASLRTLRQQMATVDVGALSPKQQLAYWMNLYNISVVGIVTEHYPVDSIRDISTDPIIRLNVFKKDYVFFGSGKMSLDEIEHEKIRKGFHDPRVHFAINCAARSCPPIRHEPFTGDRVDEQLDDQARRFLNGPNGVHFGRKGDTLIIHTTKIMDWFGDDFEEWGGGKIAFLKRYLTPEKVRLIDQANETDLEFDDYSWDLNVWKR